MHSGDAELRPENRSPSTPDDMTGCDEKWIKKAILEAMAAAAQGEVPVGAVLVRDNQLISTGRNGPIALNDPTAHAEINAIRAAAATLENYRLPGTTLYVTLEPCVMCIGAILHARIDRLVYGAPDPKSGAISSVYNIGQDGLLNHTLEIEGSVLEHKCAALLKDFFGKKRQTRKQARADSI